MNRMIELNLVEIFDNNTQKYGVYLMNNQSVQEQKWFMDSFYRSFGIRKHLNLNWFNWFYNLNPCGTCRNYVLIDMEKGTWIGGFGFAKIPYRLNELNSIGGLAVNGFINPGYEGKGLYTKLISRGLGLESSKERILFSLPHASNLASIKGHLKSGWERLTGLSFMEIKVDKSKSKPNHAVCLDQPEDLETLNFNLFNQDNVFEFMRNYNFLFWRFISRPNKKYSFLKVEMDEHIGYMVLGFYEPINGCKRCQIADYRYTAKSCLLELINSAYLVALQNKCNILDVLISENCEPYDLFSSAGFAPGKEGYELLTYTTNPVELDNTSLITYGDLDTI